MKITKFFPLILVASLVSCNKTANTPAAPSSNSNVNTSTTSGSFFNATNKIDMGSSSCSYNYDFGAQVILATACACGTKTGNIGTVSINGHSIAFVSSGGYANYGIYTDAILNQYNVCPNPGQLSGSVKWQVSGANGVSGFSFTTTKVMPVLPSFSFDTIHKQRSYTITHPTITAGWFAKKREAPLP
jgi:hypothetical protein